MRETLDAARHHSLRAEGEVELTLPSGAVAHLTGLAVERDGPLDADEGRLDLTLKGPLSELRKLAELGASAAQTLAHAAANPASKTGELCLRATPALLARLVRELPPGAATLQDAMEDEQWASTLFSFDGYDVMSVSVIDP